MPLQHGSSIFCDTIGRRLAVCSQKQVMNGYTGPYLFIPGRFPQKYRALRAGEISLASTTTGLHYTHVENIEF